MRSYPVNDRLEATTGLWRVGAVIEPGVRR